MSTEQNSFDREDDVEGHGLRHTGTVAPTDGDDVEGHGLRHTGTVAPTDEDDVEGHGWRDKL